jgi:hypothetical protein
MYPNYNPNYPDQTNPRNTSQAAPRGQRPLRLRTAEPPVTGPMRRFVNKIANYVHQAAHDNFGSANKNIGEAFLMTWQLQVRGER